MLIVEIGGSTNIALSECFLWIFPFTLLNCEVPLQYYASVGKIHNLKHISVSSSVLFTVFFIELHNSHNSFCNRIARKLIS